MISLLKYGQSIRTDNVTHTHMITQLFSHFDLKKLSLSVNWLAVFN
jgi:hypothetical protein